MPHQWTQYELHTMLSLIARGAHLENRVKNPDTKRTDTTLDTRSKTYDNFASRFNEAINGKANFSKDVDKGEIIHMLDTLMKHRKNVVGKGGLLERQPVGRITRALRQAWERSDGRDFDGSLTEWEAGRKAKVIRKDIIARGLMPKEDVLMEDAGDHTGDDAGFSFKDKDIYTSEPKAAPEAYGNRKYTPRSRKRPVTVSASGSYLDNQIGKVHAAVTSFSRGSEGRGKKSNLSFAFIIDDDEEDAEMYTPAPAVALVPPISVAPPVARPQRVLAASTIAKRNAALAVQPSQIVKKGQLGWNVTKPVSAEPLVAAEKPLKRPGKNARTAKAAKDADTSVVETEVKTADPVGEVQDEFAVHKGESTDLGMDPVSLVEESEESEEE